MNSSELLEMVRYLQNAEFGDSGRLEFIENCLKLNKKVYDSDKKYIYKKFNQLQNSLPKHQQSEDSQVGPSHTVINHTRIHPFHRCSFCNKELGLSEKTILYEGKWSHETCFKENIKNPSLIKFTQHKPNKKKDKITDKHAPKSDITRDKTRADPVLVLFASMIFALLIFASYAMFSYLSIIAISIAGVITFYHIISKRQPQTQYHYGRRGASLYSMILIALPFVLGSIISYDGYANGFMSIVETIFLWGLTISFWQTMLFVPLAIKSISKESFLKDPDVFPKISVLVPAYNEEKVMRTTIEALLATNYPDKEIIAIDDGSKDDTLKIMSEYKDRIKVVHKENGGKASALNAGLVYATGDIVTIVDADTIIGNSALLHIAKSFTNENVAAVAGNIKIRNRINILTWCQALEYLSGIQIMRRGLDYFGAITIVPGALGAFRKSSLEAAGTYHKETLVEDFDATIKVLRSGMTVSGSNNAIAYTQCPQKLKDFYKQRKRWYRGNLQVLKRHSDVLLNPRFGYLQRFAYPLLVIHMLVIPSVSMLVLGFTIYQLVIGNFAYVAFVLGMYIALQHLLSAMAVRMDRDDKKMILYSVFLVIGYKQIVDFLQLKAVIEEMFGLKAKWTSAQRVKQ